MPTLCGARCATPGCGGMRACRPDWLSCFSTVRVLLDRRGERHRTIDWCSSRPARAGVIGLSSSVASAEEAEAEVRHRGAPASDPGPVDLFPGVAYRLGRLPRLPPESEDEGQDLWDQSNYGHTVEHREAIELLPVLFVLIGQVQGKVSLHSLDRDVGPLGPLDQHPWILGEPKGLWHKIAGVIGFTAACATGEDRVARPK